MLVTRHLTLIPNTILFAALASGCTGIGEQLSDIVFFPHSRSANVKSEVVLIKSIVLKKPQPSVDGGKPEIVSAAAPIIAGLAIDQTKAAIDAEAKRYSTTYSASFKQAYNPESHYLAGIWFARYSPGDTVKIAAEAEAFDPLDDTTKQNVTLPSMTYCLALSSPTSDKNNNLWVVTPYGGTLNESKSKVVAFNLLSPFGFDIFNPWELVTNWFDKDNWPKLLNDNDLDLTINFNLGTSKLSKAKEKIESVNQIETSYAYKNIKLGSTDFVGETNVCGNSPEEFSTALAALPPASEKELSSGQFIIEPPPIIGDMGIVSGSITVTEVDEFGEKVKQFGEQFDSDKDDIKKKIIDFIDD